MTIGQRLGAGAIGAAFLFYVGLGIQTITMVQGDDLVMVSPNTGIYASVKCDFAHITEAYAPDANPFDRYDDKKLVKLSDARAMKARPDEVCKAAQGFETGHSTLSADLFLWAKDAVSSFAGRFL